jgi:hypothetical protein
MKEVRITMNDNIHKAVKVYCMETDQNQNEGIEDLLKAGLAFKRTEKKETKA